MLRKRIVVLSTLLLAAFFLFRPANLRSETGKPKLTRPQGTLKTFVKLNVRMVEPEKYDKAEALRSLFNDHPVDPMFNSLLGAWEKSKAKGLTGAMNGCCVKVRDEKGCWFWCCGDSKDSCQASCNFATCDSK